MAEIGGPVEGPVDPVAEGTDVADLERLREAVMLASGPKPGKTLAAVMSVGVWTDEAGDATMDVLCWPVGEWKRLMRNVRNMLQEMPLDG